MRYEMYKYVLETLKDMYFKNVYMSYNFQYALICRMMF